MSTHRITKSTFKMKALAAPLGLGGDDCRIFPMYHSFVVIDSERLLTAKRANKTYKPGNARDAANNAVLGVGTGAVVSSMAKSHGLGSSSCVGSTVSMASLDDAIASDDANKCSSCCTGSIRDQLASLDVLRREAKDGRLHTPESPDAMDIDGGSVRSSQTREMAGAGTGDEGIRRAQA